MPKRIILLFITKFTYRDYKRYGIEFLQSRGFKVDIWDISSLISKNILIVISPLMKRKMSFK